MVEPTRKQSPTSASVHPLRPTTESDSLTFASTHPHRPGLLDLSSFRDGDARPAGKAWKGPFSGRPLLIEQLMPSIRIRFGEAPRASLIGLLYTLRSYWRLFDKFADVAPVHELSDLTEVHGTFQLHEGFDRSDTSTFLSLVNDARANLGLNRLWWPTREDRTVLTDLPDRAHVARIYQYLKRRAYEAVDRIEKALDTEGDASPSKDEVGHLYLLFLLRTGWNAQTVLDLDVDSCLLPHPTSDAHHVVRAIKSRGGTEQIAIGLEKSVLSAGNIVRILAKGSAKTRELVQARLDELGAVPSEEEPASVRIKRARLNALRRTPWLLMGGGVPTMMQSPSLQPILQRINAGLPFDKQVNENMRASDLRDAYIAFAYEHSGYSWVIAKIAAGHKSLESLKYYLRKRQWKAHGERKVLRFGNALWQLVSERRIVDAAILHAMVENQQVGEQQVERWLAMKDRTRVGTGCLDFRNPPVGIAPHHAHGSGCRVQRCTICPHAIVFDDSVDLLTRRLAELTALKQLLPLATWLESSFPEEFEATEEVLKRFDPDTVQDGLAKWASRIASGEHRVVHLEGGYGAQSQS